jgi:hypothetical protein
VAHQLKGASARLHWRVRDGCDRWPTPITSRGGCIAGT